MKTYSRPNIVFTKGSNCHLWDLENNKYIDFSAGIAVTALGHSEPKITQIMHDQSSQLIHSSNLFHNLYTTKLSKQLVEATKQFNGMHDASNVFLANSGTEANEAALKFARKYGVAKNPAKNELITFKSSFHGRTLGSLSVTPNPKYQDPFGPMVPNVKVAEPGNLQSVANVISDNTCGIIIEPIQGEGGVNPVSLEFLTELKKLALKHDALLIYDEIQCGLGRTGKLWAHSYLPAEAHPDIFTSAKALGNGFPIAATVVSPKVENAIKIGDHGTTYGGNPLGARIASYVVNQIANADFLQSVNAKSEIFVSKLNEIKARHEGLIKDVRGKGLILGVEFAESPAKVIDEARKRGLIVISAGGNVVRFVPALTVEPEVIEAGLKIFEQAIEAVEGA